VTVSRQSADAVTVPLFRKGDGTGDQLFGMVSMHSYEPDSYDDNAVRAFECSPACQPHRAPPQHRRRGNG
jgi:hypothetical protein